MTDAAPECVAPRSTRRLRESRHPLTELDMARPFDANPFVSAALPLLLQAFALPVLSAQEAPIAIVDVNVVPMTADTVLPGRTVLVRDGRIVSVTPAAQATLPADVVRIDGSGRWLIPGLAEMHAHVPPGDAPAEAVEDMLFLYLANGVTTIRGMLGAPHQLALRDRIARGELLGPRFLVGAPSLNGNSAPDAETATRLVREHAAAGYDFLKLHPGLSRATYDAIVATASEVGITLGGHVSVEVGLERTLEAGQGTIDHLDGYLEAAVPADVRARILHPTDVITMGEIFRAVDVARAPALARATRDAGVYNVPTAALWENLFGPLDPAAAAAWPEMRYASPQQVAAWRQQKGNYDAMLAEQGVLPADAAALFAFRRTLLRELANAGALLLMGTDSPQMFSVPGFSLHREIRLMEDAGLSPFQILTAGTVNVGRYVHEVLGLPLDGGTIEPGMRADLVLLAGNPLQDAGHIAQPVGVMTAGRWLDRARIERGLEAIAARHAPR